MLVSAVCRPLYLFTIPEQGIPFIIQTVCCVRPSGREQLLKLWLVCFHHDVTQGPPSCSNLLRSCFICIQLANRLSNLASSSITSNCYAEHLLLFPLAGA